MSGEVVGFLREFGFPAAVAAFVLLRLEKRLAELSRCIQKLTLTLLQQQREDDQRGEFSP